MNEIKPKRAARETAQSEAAVADVIAAATSSVIERHAVPEPEPVSTIALAQVAPAAAPLPAAGPACPLPTAPDRSQSDRSPEPAVENTAHASPWTAFAEAQSALARGFERAAVEMTGISRSGMAATADAAVALLGARTFAEALEINAGLARRGVDTMLEGSARLSEIGAKAVADASGPILSRFGRNWGALGRG
jgi:hypothetical protein